MPAGRPSSYDPSYCERVIALGETGASIAKMAYVIGVHKETLSNWAEAFPEFFDAFTRAKLASQVHWEDKGAEGMEKPANEFQGSIWSRSMAARFTDWREKQLVGSDPENPLPSANVLNVSGLSEATLREIASAANNG